MVLHKRLLEVTEDLTALAKRAEILAEISLLIPAYAVISFLSIYPWFLLPLKHYCWVFFPDAAAI